MDKDLISSAAVVDGRQSDNTVDQETQIDGQTDTCSANRKDGVTKIFTLVAVCRIKAVLFCYFT